MIMIKNLHLIKFLNNLVEKVGIDRVLHFLVGALILAQFECFGLNLVLLSFLIVFIIAFTKEKIDTYFDWKDIGFTMLGAFVEFISFILRTLIFIR